MKPQQERIAQIGCLTTKMRYFISPDALAEQVAFEVAL
jgi:hypothetical protein